jgi:2-(1,2-epoxy-1,2-dihydrophenyl)acetyl-CoA isomerase
MDYITLEVDRREGGIRTIYLNRPDMLNAINLKMAEELNQEIENIRKDSDVKVVLVTGAGRAFCSGAELDESINTISSMRDYIHNQLNRIIMGITAMEKPWIAAVNGIAAGGGASLALAMDLVVASEEASFYFVNAKRGLVLDMGGTYFLPRFLGTHRAKEVAFFAEKISGRDAERMGLINRCAPVDEFQAAAFNWAERLSRGAHLAIGAIKIGINRGLSSDLHDVLQVEAQNQAIMNSTEDFKEGVAAFLGKRDPVFKGK